MKTSMCTDPNEKWTPMSVERMSLFAQGDNGGGGNMILFAALIAVVLLVVFIWKSFKPKRTPDGMAEPQEKPRPTSRMKQTMTAEEVASKRFQPVKLGEGYDGLEVNAFLDRIVREFQRLQDENERLHLKKANPLSEPVTITEPILTAKQVVLHDFPPNKLRGGYSPDEVDDFLDQVVIGLRQWTSENEELRAELAGNISPA
ncbi:DivIVA domain-containing protein [Arthrobacter sp. ZGTC212]|uniref:DivIVA domain-containing protein n=1 Tax=Arthrobacter sp. ZGTC212 TaxID=2058899 RepID=UPI000CE57233|nr:DivIVA domain-containing protein [Arthrobacter sp. ZGTC212]